jgi:hypothetical protein
VTEYQYLVKELQKEIEARATAVADGSCKTYDQYQNAVGIIRGLALAADLIKDREQITKDSDE